MKKENPWVDNYREPIKEPQVKKKKVREKQVLYVRKKRN